MSKPKIRAEATEQAAVTKALNRLAKRLNQAPKIMASSATDIAMITLACRARLRKGEMVASLVNSLTALAHEALDNRLTELERDLAKGEFKSNLERARCLKEFEYRQIEHDGLIQAERAKAEMLQQAGLIRGSDLIQPCGSITPQGVTTRDPGASEVVPFQSHRKPTVH